MIRKSDVARYRAYLGLSQEKFAEKLGVSVSAVGKWEIGLQKPHGLSLRALERLAKLSRRRMTKRWLAPFPSATGRVRVHGEAIGRECKVSDDVKEAE